jgi:hypothetical protein
MKIDLSDDEGEDVDEGWYSVEILAAYQEPTNLGALVIEFETQLGRRIKIWIQHDKPAGMNFLKSFWAACGYQGVELDTDAMVGCRVKVELEKHQSRKNGRWYPRAKKVAADQTAGPAKAAIPVVEVKQPEPEDNLSPHERKALVGLYNVTEREWESLEIVEGRSIPELRRWVIKSMGKIPKYDLPF